MVTLSNRRDRPPRRGILLVEMLVAMAILGVLALFFVPMARWIMTERKLIEQRTIALAEVNAVLEEWRARGVSPTEAAETDLSSELRRVLPEGKMVVTGRAVEAGEGPGKLPAGHWLTAKLRWKPPIGNQPMEISQTAWLAGGDK